MSTASIGAIPARRGAWAVAAAALLGLLVLTALRTDATWWHAALAWLAPDLPLLAAMGRGLERGRLHPRAVPAYNAAHRLAGPLALLGLSAALGFAALPLTVSLAWLLHIAIDRAVGYGLRTPAGYRRA